MTPVAPFRTPTRSPLRARLLAWYDAKARDLPWRVGPAARRAGHRPDPYAVWLSEIMLQQTTVPHAIPYFLAFIRRWPTVGDLAAAPEGEVMAAWAGLGYYARARNLLACARGVAGDLGGTFPDSEAGLRDLPGVGAYTAAAVAAIAFDRPANVVDGNIERVMARLYAVETPLPAAKGELASLAATLVGPDRPGDWAQALMDLGAMICRPKAPACDDCPLAKDCRALALGAPQTWPRRAPKPVRPHRNGACFILRHGGDIAMVRRPPRGLFGGMLGLPTTPWRTTPWSRTEALAVAPSREPWCAVGSIGHVFTHFSLSLTVMEAMSTDRSDAFIWAPLAQALSATPTVFRKALSLATAGPVISITSGNLTDPRVLDLLRAHVSTARAQTAPGSAHALDVSGLKGPAISVWTLWRGADLASIGALKRIGARHGEVKSMHTAAAHRGCGAGGAMLRHIIAAARTAGFERLSLETGASAYFAPARALYSRHGFIDCPPFGDYRDDPNSHFMSLDLSYS